MIAENPINHVLGLLAKRYPKLSEDEVANAEEVRIEVSDLFAWFFLSFFPCQFARRKPEKGLSSHE